MKWQKAVKPFVILGMNAIAIYVISELLVVTLGMLDWQQPIYRAVFVPLASPLNASLLYAVCYTLLMMLIAWVMYRRRVFIKV
jgi:predicted acyltransferase